jgi:hypothetical protein
MKKKTKSSLQTATFPGMAVPEIVGYFDQPAPGNQGNDNSKKKLEQIS